MKKRFPGLQARGVAVLFLVLVLCGLALLVSEFSFRYRWAHDTLATLEPRHARFAGVRDAGELIQGGTADIHQKLARVAHPASTEIPRIGTDLQQRMRRMADENDLRVSGSQIQPTREQEEFVVVSVAGTLEGEIDSIGEFLLRLQSEEPPVLVEKLAIQTPRARRGVTAGVRVTVQLTLSVLRLQP